MEDLDEERGDGEGTRMCVGILGGPPGLCEMESN